MKPAIITLLTDFGAQDYFVAAMKGVILSINPQAQIVDISHEIPPQNIHAAAFNLLAVHREFPTGTIHVGVIDPGVGSERRAILIECAGQLFVGPDNGLFSWVARREGEFRVYQISNENFFHHPVSNTFHGRDIFAPVAGALSTGIEPHKVGPLVDTIVELESLNPQIRHDGAIKARIIHIDRFGNCITNLTREHLRPGSSGRPQLLINGRQVTSFREFFAETNSGGDEVFMVPGSAGFIEIAARNASAATMLDARRGQSVLLHLQSADANNASH